MRLLLDTCTFLWLALEPSKISPAATLALDDEANELFLSDASVWEIALKHKAGKLPLGKRCQMANCGARPPISVVIA